MQCCTSLEARRDDGWKKRVVELVIDLNIKKCSGTKTLAPFAVAQASKQQNWRTSPREAADGHALSKVMDTSNACALCARCAARLHRRVRSRKKSLFRGYLGDLKKDIIYNDSTLFTVKTKIKKMISAHAGGAYSEEVFPQHIGEGGLRLICYPLLHFYWHHVLPSASSLSPLLFLRTLS